MHPINMGRHMHGEFHNLFDQLVEDDAKFFKYFRMTYGKFCFLLENLTLTLQKKDTSFGQCVGPKERLVVCLR